jgi:hypothetical protein
LAIFHWLALAANERIQFSDYPPGGGDREVKTAKELPPFAPLAKEGSK